MLARFSCLSSRSVDANFRLCPCGNKLICDKKLFFFGRLLRRKDEMAKVIEDCFFGASGAIELIFEFNFSAYLWVVRRSINGGKGLGALVARVMLTSKIQWFNCGLLADIAPLAHNDYNNINMLNIDWISPLTTKFKKVTSAKCLKIF